MALSATIYKFNVSLSDLDRNIYESLPITIAQHPSETPERMLARLIAYCCHFTGDIEFTKGLSTPETPDIWIKSLTDEVLTWIEVGEPSYQKLKKATRLAKDVRVYSFNTKSNVWWAQEQKALSGLKVSILQLPYEPLAAFAAAISRTIGLSITISEASVYISTETQTFELPIRTLQSRVQ